MLGQTIPITRNRHLTIPFIIPLLTLLLLVGYVLLPSRHSLPFTLAPDNSRYLFTSSSMRIDRSRFMPPGDKNPIRRPDYLPAPIPPKASGMVVPNSVHYVFGLKPVKEGEKGEELPYYAYLAMRSALVNIKPAKMYL